MWVDKNTILKLYFDNKFETTSFFWKAINFEDQILLKNFLYKF